MAQPNKTVAPRPPESPSPKNSRPQTQMSTRPPSTLDSSGSRPATSLDMTGTMRPESTLAVVDSTVAVPERSDDPDEWYAEADTRLVAAMKVFKFADRHFTNTARMHYKAARDGTRHYQRFSRLQELFKNNCTRRHVRNQLMERLESLQHSIKATRRCLSDVQSVKEKQGWALQLCSWRLEQRAARPAREHCADGFEVALEQEQDVYIRQQERLRQQEEECAKNLIRLEEMFEALSQDPIITRKKALPPPEGDDANPERKTDSPTEIKLEKAEQVGQELLSFLDMEGMTLRQLWQVMDDNDNGRTTMEEFTEGLMNVHFVDDSNPLSTMEACNSLFKGIDEDMTGSLSWKEVNQFFDDLLDKLRKTHPVGQALLEYLQEREWPLRQLWGFIDDGTDGRVEPDEFIRGMDNAGFLNNALENHDVAGCHQFFQCIDADRTGVISWHEFQSFFAELVKMAEAASKGRDAVRELSKKLAMANATEREAKWTREESQDAMRSSGIDQGYAQRRVNAECKKQIQMRTNLKKRLEFLLAEAESRIRIHSWRATWKDHAEVIQTTKNKRTGKKYFTDRADPVAAAEDLENQDIEEPLEVLEEALDALKQDYEDKSAALAIDERCKYARCVGGEIKVEFPPIAVSPKTGHMGLALPAPNPARPTGRAKSSPVSARPNSAGRKQSKPKGNGFGSSAREDPSFSQGSTPGPGLYSAEQSKAAWSFPAR